LSLADEEGRYAVDARAREKAVAMVGLDVLGDEPMAHVAMDAEVRLDQGAASVGIDLGASYEVSTITATPLLGTHRIAERDIMVSVSTYNDVYAAVEDWSFTTLDDGSLYIRLAKPEKARYVKLHCRYDERNADGTVADASTFKNSARSIVTVGYYETSRRESYWYDDQGNRSTVETRVGGKAETTGYELYANSDRVKRSGDRAYVYDANGNMTERGTALSFSGDTPYYETDDYYRRYEYDLQNRLMKVWGYKDTVLITLATYAYAGDNLRLSKTANGATTRYIHGVDGNELYRVAGSDSTSTVWLFGRKLVEIAKVGGVETRTYLHTDHIGTVVSATDETGNTIWTGDNTAFGIATADTGLESRTASYTGKDYDAEAGLYYFNARWYDAELARFTTEDPARDDINWYVYCANNPMTHTDPTGLVQAVDEDENGRVTVDRTWRPASTSTTSSSGSSTSASSDSSLEPDSRSTAIEKIPYATDIVSATLTGLDGLLSGSQSQFETLIMMGKNQLNVSRELLLSASTAGLIPDTEAALRTASSSALVGGRSMLKFGYFGKGLSKTIQGCIGPIDIFIMGIQIGIENYLYGSTAAVD